MTELAALPGLEVVDRPTPVERARPLARSARPTARLMLFSGRSNPELAPAGSPSELGIELGDVELKTFANGETYCRYLESIRGADVFIVQSAPAPSPNDQL